MQVLHYRTVPFTVLPNTSSASSGGYSNLYKTGKYATSSALKSFQPVLNTAISSVSKLIPDAASWAPYITELVGRESSWNPNAKNPGSTAHGYGQFLDKTVASYEKKYGIKYDTPEHQLMLTMLYVKDRYGTPQKALAEWDKKGWY
jgi:muramidase (phage lysozyme)